MRNHRASPNAIRAPHGKVKSNEIPPVWSIGYPPGGKRHRWLLIVQTCPTCRATHHHFSPGPHGGIRRAGCGRGSYLLKSRPALAQPVAS